MKLEQNTTAKPILKAPSLDADSLRLTALEVSEIRYRRLFEAARDGILILDATTSKITDSNPFMTELLGYSCEELYGKELADIGVFKDKGAAHDAMAQLHRDSYIRYDDLPLETKSHERRDVEFVSNVYSENGIDVIQCNIRDNTERKRLKKAAAAKERERDYVLSAAQCLLYYADVTQSDHPNQLFWDSHFVDEAAAQRFLPLALEPGERYSQARYRSRHPGDRDRCDAYGTRMIRAGQSYTQEFRSFRADHRICWIREDVQVETIVPDHSWRVVCVCTDVTQLKEQQNALKAANTRLRRAMAETHHRVKNNLQMIAAMIDIQLMEATNTVPTSVVMRLGTQVQALAILHDLLTDESKKDVEARSLDAHDVLSKLLPLIQATVRTRIAFQGDHARFAVSQAASLCLIANEIITNAIKHGSDTVNIIFRADDQDAELIVEDNGPGFPKGFDPDTMSNHGLEMACQMARTDLAGSIVFETKEGGGGRVTLKMPQFNQILLKEANSSFASF
jgi:PAS domain S-box-containing protein